MLLSFFLFENVETAEKIMYGYNHLVHIIIITVII